MDESLKRVILEYLNENRYFTKEGLEKKINKELGKEKEEYLQKKINLYNEHLKDDPWFPEKEEKEKELKKYEKNEYTRFNNDIYSVYLPKVLNENFILLEYKEVTPKKIFILREKEAEFFAFIFNFYKNNCTMNVISREYIEEVKSLLDMGEEIIDKMAKDGVLFKINEKEGVYSQIPIQSRREIFQSSEIENKIFLKITSLNINKNFKKLKEEMKEAEAKIIESNKKIEEAEARIIESNKKIEEAEEKIDKTIKSIENTKVDTLALLAIFVAIISIIYGNIFVSNTQSIKNIVITNVSTVACIAFILGYIEIFIKDNKIMKKGYFISTTMIIVALALIISAYYD
ncbi:hypothetical protein [uncultured Fusobacterium sp.]|uniref:coiled-coil domain-containing protein n=1 Tax=uncultured Fusobacterium sp. TaxID=159267 RepID=UPI0025D2CD79|nr:hypothetical protein [uncultured Fusobacterium sp.]